MLKVSYSAHDARGGPVILGILSLIVFGIDTAFWIPAVMLASLADRDARLAYRMAQHWAAFNLKLTGTHVVVDGLEQLDPRQSYVFMSNHRSNLDVLVLVEALWKFQLRWVAKEELFRIPGFGWGLRATKQILVNRADHAQAVASLAAAKQRMHDRISVVFFPEGTRGCGGEMLPFKKGGLCSRSRPGRRSCRSRSSARRASCRARVGFLAVAATCGCRSAVPFRRGSM